MGSEADDFLDLLYGEVVRLKSFPIPPPPDLELSTLGLEVEDTGKRPITASHPHITKDFLQQFKGQIFCKEQLLFFEHRGARVHMRVSFATQKAGNACRGKLVKQTEIHFFESDLFKVSDQKEVKMILRRDLNIHDLAAEMKSLGVGGFGNELKDVFSMLVVPRFIPQEYAREVRCKYKQGIIFHGPPGTGKTLIARAISKIVNGKLQIVRGPEIFSNFMGSSEAKIRAVFNSAINDLIEKGDKSPLHVIVFDELDSIAREKGINPSDTTADRVVNQLLTMIDGYSELSNVLLVGTTNQLELIDKALMRPGRFELHMEIGLPNEAGRKEILRINVKRLQWKGALSSSVNLDELAKETKGFSGAALAALIQTAFFLAVTRAVPENIADTVWADAKVEQEDIDRAFGKLKLTGRTD
uniref:Vesicle-fusing ATPase n=2 Tax=Nicotiana tabacum TaxID=4097 RepID=A0A1S4ABG3_TOBAC|nr:PREDICTED: vesicular-fusion protein SEC18-like isoform X2 [Nicotiana tabacum]